MKSEMKAPLFILLFLLSMAAASGADSLGWRGDGSGKYPDARPVLQWSRTSKAVQELRFQAKRPDGYSKGRPMPDGVIREWLVLGPLPMKIEDTEERYGFGHSYSGKTTDPLGLGDETGLQPTVGEKGAGKTWTLHKADTSTVDFKNLYQDISLDDLEEGRDYAAYAHSYIHAEQERTYAVNINNRGAMFFWLNGKLIGKPEFNRTTELTLKKGWNRLLVRVQPTRRQFSKGRSMWPRNSWYASVCFYGMPGSTYETSNLLWAAEMPNGYGFGSPILVDNRLFLQSGYGDLFCVDADTGRILWLRSNLYHDFATEAEQREHSEVFKEIAPLDARLKEINASFARGKGPRLEKVKRGHRTGYGHREKEDLENRICDLMRKVDRKKYALPRHQNKDTDMGYGAFHAVSDGKHVFAWFATGVTVCYDLDGKLIWRNLDNRGGYRGHHGYTIGPFLHDSKLLTYMTSLLCRDASDGRLLWERDSPFGHMQGQFVGAEIAGEPVAIASSGGVLRMSDGAVLWDGPPQSKHMIPAPVVEGKTCYQLMGKNTSKNAGSFVDKNSLFPNFYRISLPESVSTPLDVKVDALTVDTRTFPADYIYFHMSSPIVHDGLAYLLNNAGVLTVVDVERMEIVYQKYLDLDQSTGWGEAAARGIGISPVLAGEHLFVFGATGACVVLKPGRTYQKVAKNKIEHTLHRVGNNMNERFVGCPVFAGERAYIRGEANLYCVGEKGKSLAQISDATDGRESGGRTQVSPAASGEGKNEKSQARIPAPTDRHDSAGSPQASPSVRRDAQPAVRAGSYGFRGNGSGVYPGARIPLEWSSDTRPRWEVEIGEGYGSPVVSGRRVFVTAEADKLHCVDLTDGKILWTRTNGFDQLPKEQAANARKPPADDCGYAASTPYTDGRHVWVVYGTGVVACYDMEGKRRWIRYIDYEQFNEYGRSASPVMADGKLIVTITHLIALDPETGRTLWEQPEAKEAYGTPAVTRIGTSDVLVTPSGYLVAADDGRVVAGGIGTALNASPVVHNGVVYFCDTETSAWKLPNSPEDKPEELWFAEIPGEVFASPVLHDGILYCVDNAAYFYAINAADGEILYEEQLTGGDMPMDMTPFYPSLILANGRLLVSNCTGQTAIIKPGPNFTPLRINERRPGSGSTPAIDAGNLLMRSGSQLYMPAES